VAVGEPRPTDEREIAWPTIGRLVVRYQPVVKLYDERIVGLRRRSVDWHTSEKEHFSCLPDILLCRRDRDGFHRDVERWRCASRRVDQFGALCASNDVRRGPTTVDRASNLFERGSVADPDSWLVGPSDQPTSGVHAVDVIVEINRTDPPRRSESAVEFLSQLSDLVCD